MATWMLVNAGLFLYTRSHAVPRLCVDYGSLCENAHAALTEIRLFLGLDEATGDGSPSVRRGSYHLMRSKQEVRRVASGEREFEGLRYHGDTSGLSRPVRVVARLAIDPLYRLLVSGGGGLVRKGLLDR